MIGIIKITTYRYLNLPNPNQLTPLTCHSAYKHILKSLKCIFTANKNHFHSNKTQKNKIITKITLIYMHCKWALRQGWVQFTLARLTFSTSLSFHAKCERSSIHSFFISVVISNSGVFVSTWAEFQLYRIDINHNMMSVHRYPYYFLGFKCHSYYVTTN